MKRVLFTLLAVCATAAYAGENQTAQTTKNNKATATKNTGCACCSAKTSGPAAAKTAVVTGSNIPLKVDKNGRPLNSTLDVTVIDEKTIQVFGMGSPGSALSRLPTVSFRGGR